MYATQQPAHPLEQRPNPSTSIHLMGSPLAHNGNLTNAEELSRYLRNECMRHVNTTSDSELLLNALAVELGERSSALRIQGDPHMNIETVFGAVSAVNSRVRVAMPVFRSFPDTAFLPSATPTAFVRWSMASVKSTVKPNTSWPVKVWPSRRWALRSYVMCSLERRFSSAPPAICFQAQCSEPASYTPCIFEHVYFARPDSVIDGMSVYQSRLNQGQRLAERLMESWPDHDIDVVIPIPDSGSIAALQMAKALNLPYREGFVKNRYVGRTFIMPGQAQGKNPFVANSTPLSMNSGARMCCWWMIPSSEAPPALRSSRWQGTLGQPRSTLHRLHLRFDIRTSTASTCRL